MENNEEIKAGFIENPAIKHDSCGEGSAICQLVELMHSVDVDSPEAKLNATTISDGKGGRILL